MDLLKKLMIMINGTIVYLMGAYDQIFKLLLFLIVMDIVSGLFSGILNKNLDSEKMLVGGVKKIGIFFVIMVAVQLDVTFNHAFPLREITILYYIVEEGLSFIENISSFMTLPNEFIQYFENIKKGDSKAHVEKLQNH